MFDEENFIREQLIAKIEKIDRPNWLSPLGFFQISSILLGLLSLTFLGVGILTHCAWWLFATNYTLLTMLILTIGFMISSVKANKGIRRKRNVLKKLEATEIVVNLLQPRSVDHAQSVIQQVLARIDLDLQQTTTRVNLIINVGGGTLLVTPLITVLTNSPIMKAVLQKPQSLGVLVLLIFLSALVFSIVIFASQLGRSSWKDIETRRYLTMYLYALEFQEPLYEVAKYAADVLQNPKYEIKN
ncbi:hypothetical protein [Schleiferilactobacillus perolens]|uniref:Uncharacterized protein n=1 Tax=Schleiferilactobacillus perolens DSM 12744 TaxID=1423792 RepID=A0A0R1MWL5_9LACO|nr:hypothetical protein [Schleiferilactobacillus perolens]KRL12583.1 hypothetical protein FD09_GL002902 [Schleiferilactobacillus perolens DSM 12744]